MYVYICLYLELYLYIAGIFYFKCMFSFYSYFAFPVSLSPTHQIIEKIFKVFFKMSFLRLALSLWDIYLVLPLLPLITEGKRSKDDRIPVNTELLPPPAPTIKSSFQNDPLLRGKRYDGNFSIEMSELADYFLVTEALFSIDVLCIEHLWIT